MQHNRMLRVEQQSSLIQADTSHLSLMGLMMVMLRLQLTLPIQIK